MNLLKKRQYQSSGETSIPSNANDTTEDFGEDHNRKSALLALFTESGVAKLGGVIQHLGRFLDDPMSGKV